MAIDNKEIDISNVPNFKSSEDGFIQLTIRKADGIRKSSFYVAELSERVTVGAAKYLAKNWRQLKKKFKDDESFSVLFKFPSSNIDKYSIVLERKIG